MFGQATAVFVSFATFIATQFTAGYPATFRLDEMRSLTCSSHPCVIRRQSFRILPRRQCWSIDQGRRARVVGRGRIISRRKAARWRWVVADTRSQSIHPSDATRAPFRVHASSMRGHRCCQYSLSTVSNGGCHGREVAGIRGHALPSRDSMRLVDGAGRQRM
jgi:hypothetical protein